MASNTVPVHGKLGALYCLRPNGFVSLAGSGGLNDAVYSAGYNGVATGYFEVEIQSAGAPDQFKWRKNGGAWTLNVAITGAAQALSDNVTITFTATTGHTVGDKWWQGNLAAEACTVVGASAQITATANRIINPNAPPTFTDSGGKRVLQVNYGTGTARFDGNATVVTAAGNNGFFPAGALQKVGYLIDWSLTVNLDMADMSRMGQQWKEYLPGQASGSGSANGYYIPGEALFNCLQNTIAAGAKYFFLQLFTWDQAQDQTGDHYNVWAALNSFALSPAIGEVVKETVNFQVQGEISFTADT